MPNVMDSSPYLLPATLIGVTTLAYFWRRSQRDSRVRALPPCPPSHPLFGHLSAFPRQRWYETFTSWQPLYGDLIYLDILGNKFVILSSLDIARELLVARGGKYMGRPGSVMHFEVLGWDWALPSVQPGHVHMESRTIFRKNIGPQEVARHESVIKEECSRFLSSMTNFKGDPWEVIHFAVSAVILRIAYGDIVYHSHGRELARLNDEALEHVTWVTTQVWFVNFFPFLHYLPDWLPLPFKREGRKGRAMQAKLRYWAWEEVVKLVKEGKADESIASQAIEEGEDLDVARDTVGIMYSGGVDNTSSTLMVFVATILLRPDVQRKIQEELDQSIDDEELPRYEDREKFPYFYAAWRESIRMHPTTPISPPHTVSEDDVYNGIFIPKGTAVWPNVGFMCRDSRIWDQPDVYKPERWLPSYNAEVASLPDVEDIVFGFGRRSCPGQWLADRVDFMFAATILKYYHILPLPGQKLPEEWEYQDAFTRRPENVQCQFRPRH